MNKFIKTALVCFLLALGCGSANSGTIAGPEDTTPTYNIVVAFKKMLLRGQAVSMNISGDCIGKLTIQNMPVSVSSIIVDGNLTVSTTESTALMMENCRENPSLVLGSISSGTKVRYFDANYLPLGLERVGKDFGVFIAASSVPRLVKAGDSGAIGSISFFTDSRKIGTPSRREEVSYVVEPSSYGNVIVNIVTKYYDTFFYPASALEAIEQCRYVVTSDGTMTRLSIDMQYLFPPKHIVSKYDSLP